MGEEVNLRFQVEGLRAARTEDRRPTARRAASRKIDDEIRE
jgi:hypothetical protein